MAGLIAPHIVEQVRAANDIVDVIGSYFPLKRAGANFVALCPFHKEKSPSFNVNPHRQIFHCFGCHKGGDVFTFVREYENFTFTEAVKRLADRVNIPLEFDESPGEANAGQVKNQLLEIHEQITKRWQTALTNEAAGQAAREYLVRRGVTDQAVELFRLGFAPEEWDDTVNWGRGKGFDVGLVEKAGLILRKEGTDRFYDRFRGRLMFPICDEQGRVIGFSGRLLEEGAKAAKYVNSPETPIFHKSKVFFGLDKAKRAILEEEHAIICEGQLDMMACYMAGIKNVVAPQGTAFTSDHARILKRYVDEVVVCFDSDQAGQEAAVRAHDNLLESGLAMRVALMPSPHDPDTFIREFGAEAFRKRMAEAEGFFDFYLGRLCEGNDLGTDKGRMAVLKQMADSVYKTHNQVLIDTYAQKTAQRLGVTSESVRQEFVRQQRARRYQAPSREDGSPEAPETIMIRPSPPEYWLIKVLFMNDDLVDWVRERLDLEWLSHPVVRRLIGNRLAAQADQSWRGLPAFLGQVENEADRVMITEAVSEKRALPDPEKVLKGDMARKGLIEVLRNDFVDRQLKALQGQAGQPGLSDEAVADIETRKSQLRKLKDQPLDGVEA